MNPRRRRLVQVLGGVALLVLVQIGAILGYQAVEARRTAEDVPFEVERLVAIAAPELKLETASGRTVRLTEHRGQIVIVHFWATWCGPCEREIPHLLAFARRHRADGVRLLAVSLDASWEVVRAFFKGTIPEEVVRGADGGEGAHYGVSTLPDTFVVRPDGTMAMRMFGARDWRARRAEIVVLVAR